MSYDWLFFDADGTLFDYRTAEAAAIEGAFRQTGLPYDSSIGRRYSMINSAIWREYELGEITQDRLRTERFDRLFAAQGFAADSTEFSRRYLRILGAQTKLLDGAEEVVRALAGRVGMLLLTNGLAEVQRPRVAASTIGVYFSELVISEEVGLAKPDPAIFHHALECAGGPARDRVLIVGDNLGSDIAGGATFGLDTCWYNPEGAPNGLGVTPTYEIRELAELLGIVEAEG